MSAVKIAVAVLHVLYVQVMTKYVCALWISLFTVGLLQVTGQLLACRMWVCCLLLL